MAAKTVAEWANEVKPIGGHGGPRIGCPRREPLPSTRGGSAAYLAARIARDRPDVLERMKRGEFATMRAAAAAAGLVKDRVGFIDEPAFWARAIDRRFPGTALDDLWAEIAALRAAQR